MRLTPSMRLHAGAYNVNKADGSNSVVLFIDAEHAECC